MKIAGDTHTHTLLCQHAYSTLLENIQAAAAAVRLRPAWRVETDTYPYFVDCTTGDISRG